MADRGSANGTVQATGNGPGFISISIHPCLLFFVCLCVHNPNKIDIPTYFRATTNSATELTASLSYSSAAASPSTPISSSQGAAAAEVNACVSQACLRDLARGSFFTDTPTAVTNCAILPLHTAQLFPPLNISSREVPPVSSLRAQKRSCGRPACRTNYRFDSFVSYQCLCVIVLLFVRLNGITVNKIYSLDLLCSTAGLRFAKSVSPYATTIVVFLQEFQGGIDQRVSELRFLAGLFPPISFVSGAAVVPNLLFTLYFLPLLHAPLNLA